MLNDAKRICLQAIETCKPQQAVRKELENRHLNGDLYLVAVGKAAYPMALAASKILSFKDGILLSKYGHIPEPIEPFHCYEAGHPILDENGIRASEKILAMCRNLQETDTVVFLLSGGASALFEKPLIPLSELKDLNEQMLKKGLKIEEINTIRKKLSAIKGGRFAKLCEPAKVYSIILSDVLDDKPEVIGSGPTADDPSTAQDALKLLERYDLHVSQDCLEVFRNSKPVRLSNSHYAIIGSVRILAENARKEAEKLGYKAIVLSDHVDCDAHAAGNLLVEEVRKHLHDKKDTAILMAGETTVKVKGNGLGGRNQELVLSQAKAISGWKNVLLMSLGSDGTDGPTDAAGAYVDGDSYGKLKQAGIDLTEVLNNNDSYHALEKIGCLIKTGPTMTNVNDITIALIKNQSSI